MGRNKRKAPQEQAEETSRQWQVALGGDMRAKIRPWGRIRKFKRNILSKRKTLILALSVF
jgi:hypothetical protein